MAGFDLVVQSFDDRDDVRLAHASGEDRLDLAHLTTEFDHLGELVEWRLAGKKIAGLILRLYVDRTSSRGPVPRHS